MLTLCLIGKLARGGIFLGFFLYTTPKKGVTSQHSCMVLFSAEQVSPYLAMTRLSPGISSCTYGVRAKDSTIA